VRDAASERHALVFTADLDIGRRYLRGHRRRPSTEA
jgi:hypothetical protein